MLLDYDLVILGGTPVGRQAAWAATMTGARVALVEPGGQPIVVEQLLRQGLRLQMASDWSALKAWLAVAKQCQPASHSLVELGLRGVDVIGGTGHFKAAKRLGFEVENRLLWSRSYLIATGSQPRCPVLAGLTQSQILTPTELMAMAEMPAAIALIGCQSASVAWAVALACFGVQPTLILEHDRFLPAADQDIQRLVQSQLRAIGIQMMPQSLVTQIKPGPAQGSTITWADGHREVGAILLVDAGQPNIVSLGLESLGVSYHPRGLWVNSHLQTTHPRIYAAGAVLGGEDLLELASQEVSVAVHNALFWPHRRISYSGLAYGWQGLDEVGQVGLTEQQARQVYGEALQIFQSSALPIDQKTPYALQFCKLIARNDGRLVGMHVIGNGARDLAVAIAPALTGQFPTAPTPKPFLRSSGLTLDILAQWPAPPHTLAAVVQQTAYQAIQPRWNPGQWRRDWAENWFNWRRSRQ